VHAEFDFAEQIFATLHAADPHTVDYMDIYSNTLFVNENRKQLGILAHQCSQINRYRPETHLIIGNYYSIRGMHEKAIVSFQRALKLDRNYLSAWTLMGHEFLELGNTYAALESYRRAIDVNPKDYRAWFGLGQTYEMLRMTFYSLHYYQRATALRSNDPRMWSALAQVYESLNMNDEAIRCLVHATAHCMTDLLQPSKGGAPGPANDGENAVIEDQLSGTDRASLMRLGKLYAKKQDVERCVFHYTLALRNWDSEEVRLFDFTLPCILQ
jgi:anaphase-promoting complex subunit 8